MNTRSFSPARRFFRRVLLNTATTILAVAASAATTVESASALKNLGYSGSQAVLAALDAELAAARQDPAKLASLEQSLLAIVRDPGSTFAARQAACQRLGHVLQITPAQSLEAALKALRPLLSDERDIDLARLALEPVPGEAVDTVFLQALENSSGRARLGLVQALGARRSSNAVTKLGDLTGDAEHVVARASIVALGEIGGTAALAALERAPAKYATLITPARLAAVRLATPAEAVPLLVEIQDDRRLSPHVRAAAFRMILDIEPAAAISRINHVLGSGDWSLQEAALDAIASMPAEKIVPPLAVDFATWVPAIQIAVLSSFSRKGHDAAVPAVLKAAAHENAKVRQAALLALGFLPGDADIVQKLALAVSTAGTAEAKAARESLTRLQGPDVTTAIIDGAERGDPALRVACIEQLALRSTTEALPLLLATRGDSDVKIRIAAVIAVGDLGTMAEQGALIEWVKGATDETEQTRAIRALVDLTLRDPSLEKRGSAIYSTIEKAPLDLALRLLPALQRLGGTASAECAARLAKRDEPTLAATAAATLARWSDHTALPPLATVAENAVDTSTRQTALDGALRYLERNREPWTPTTTQVISRLLASTSEIEPRRQLIALLHRADDRTAITVARKAAADPALASAARDAIEVIRANLAGPTVARGSGDQENVKNIFDGKTGTRWSVAARGEEWIEIDFKRSRPLRMLTLDQTGRVSDFPERYEVYVTDDRRAPGVVRASGIGQRMRTIITLPEGTRGRYAIIRNTAERSDPAWSVSELYVD